MRRCAARATTLTGYARAERRQTQANAQGRVRDERGHEDPDGELVRHQRSRAHRREGIVRGAGARARGAGGCRSTHGIVHTATEPSASPCCRRCRVRSGTVRRSRWRASSHAGRGCLSCCAAMFNNEGASRCRWGSNVQNVVRKRESPSSAAVDTGAVRGGGRRRSVYKFQHCQRALHAQKRSTARSCNPGVPVPPDITVYMQNVKSRFGTNSTRFLSIRCRPLCARVLSLSRECLYVHVRRL
jgi:hypothetical protein